MSTASHWLRYSLFALILAAVAFGAVLTHTASPVSAVGPLSIYVDDGYGGTNGASCLAHTITYDACYNTITGAIGGATPDSKITPPSLRHN